ncbi:MAG: chemotaxis protein CheC, partial [Oscillospiraceae bacterium]|nr:chemotaxis protein CheC [Oscillospiraceae bacterium]
MGSNIFTPLEIDAIGEIMNISLGSSATAVSNLLDHRVDITTPKVSIVNAEEFTLGELNPAIGVEIRYVAGLDGSNIMLLKMADAKVIVDLLMGMETPDEEFELNELTLSAVCEVMNQMMGSSSTALSDFLGRVVNISTPVTFDGNDLDMMRKQHLPVEKGPIVVVTFTLSIEGSMESEFMNVMSVELAKELVSGFGLGEGEDSSGVLEAEVAAEDSGSKPLSQAEIEAMMAAASAPAPAPSPAPAPAPSSSGGVLSQEEIERLMGGGASITPPPAPASSGGVLSQEEIERLMGGGASVTPPPAPAPSGGVLSQEEIERLMSGGGASAPAPAPAPAPAGGGRTLSQAEIEAMLSGGG